MKIKNYIQRRALKKIIKLIRKHFNKFIISKNDMNSFSWSYTLENSVTGKIPTGFKGVG